MTVTERRTEEDWAGAMRTLVKMYPDVEAIRVVLDNLNTRRPGALYKTYPSAEARRILDRLEFHYTPVQGSRLNMAEIEINVLSRQYLAEGIPDGATLRSEFRTYEPLEDDGSFEHKYVVHSDGEYAGSDVYVNTGESHASLFRRWLSPHRGLSKDKRRLSEHSSYAELLRKPERSPQTRTPDRTLTRYSPLHVEVGS